MIHVIATIHTAPGRRAEFLKAFHELVPQVWAEAGCLAYGPAVDVDTPLSGQPPRADAVTVVEQWEDTTSLQNHLAAPHMNSFRNRVRELVTGIEIRVLEPA